MPAQAPKDKYCQGQAGFASSRHGEDPECDTSWSSGKPWDGGCVSLLGFIASGKNSAKRMAGSIECSQSFCYSITLVWL